MGRDELLPYFIRAEDSERGTNDFHGSGGPLPVSMARARNAIERAFIDAAVAGLPASDDFNGPDQDGVGWYDFQLARRLDHAGITASEHERPDDRDRRKGADLIRGRAPSPAPGRRGGGSGRPIASVDAPRSS